MRYTEEEAEYLSVRPVVRQTFRLEELLDMVLVVTGKNLARIQQILRAGTIVFHFYRYWWEGFETDPQELAAVLARFPDDDPARVFPAEECAVIILESAGHPPRHALELDRQTAARKRLLRSQSFWDCLLELGRMSAPAYQGYSYARRADLYRLELGSGQLAGLLAAAARLAPRDLRAVLRHLPDTRCIVFVCPRSLAEPSTAAARAF